MKLEYDDLIGNKFTGIGQQDCFALVRPFFKTNFGIEIPDFARPHDWKSNDLDLIRRCSEQTDFEQITNWKIKDLRPADVLAIMIHESNPNHLAVVVEDGQIIHHLYGRLSTKEPLRDFWLNHTAFVLRHPDVPDLRPVYPDITLTSILHERNSKVGRQA